MVDLEILKVFAKTEKTEEDIEILMNMTQGLKFVISYNDPEIHKLICKNLRIQSYVKNECIYDSSKMTDIDFLVYSGKVNLYLSEKPGLRIVFSDEEKENDRENKDKKSNTNKKNKKEEKNEDENDIRKMTLIRELKPGDCFGFFEIDIMKRNIPRFNKLLAYSSEESKVLIFENRKILTADNKEVSIRSRRDIKQSQREMNQQDKNNPKYYDPEIFLFDDPQKITSVIDNVKEQLIEKFDNDEDIKLGKDLISEMKREKEFSDACDHLSVSDLKDTINYIENKYEDYYTDQSILELKLGAVLQKSINSLEKAKNTVLNDMDNLSHKYYDKKNNKNKNLVQLNIDNELKDSKFEDFVIEKLNREKNLDDLLKQKKANDRAIEINKKNIKKEENKLLNTYYCIFCHIKPRNAMGNNCNHLVVCEECIQKTKVCPRCGKNIDNYEKVYRNQIDL